MLEQVAVVLHLALKKTMPKAEVWGCDVSDEALNVARRNGSELDIRVDFPRR